MSDDATPDMASRPKAPPPGADPHGQWTWGNGKWSYWDPKTKTYTDATGAVSNRPTNSVSLAATDGGGGAGGVNQGGYSNPESTATALPTGPNPFGNEMMNMPASYTPFGLQSSFGSPGMGGGPGGSQFSYLSDQLVPSLEQRRMGMINQMVTPQGGK